MVISIAIRDRQLLSFNYEGYGRLVEPHTYGVDSKGHPALRAFQVSQINGVRSCNDVFA